jgi:murein DD-endopeptidase MepM/ murein hydrolase activator NlpD
MRLKLLFLALTLFLTNTYSQLNPSLFRLGNSLEDIAKHLNINIDNEIFDIKASHWETQIFNPYKDETVKFPFQIKFQDSVYNAPILKPMVITSRYGWRWRRAHQGIDIDLIKGDNVASMLDGVVRFAQYNPGHGKLVIVRHYNGLETAYAHLSSIAVKANDTVLGGQIIGKGGTTGNAKGSHLHLITSFKGVAINPEYLFDFSGTDRIRANEIWVTQRWATAYYHSSRQKTKMELLQTEEEAIASLKREKKIYVVKKGDTLSRISQRNHVSIRSICINNNIKSTSLLKIGQKLYID